MAMMTTKVKGGMKTQPAHMHINADPSLTCKTNVYLRFYVMLPKIEGSALVFEEKAEEGLRIIPLCSLLYGGCPS